MKKNAQAKWQCFPETRHLGESKNEKFEIFCGRPKKLSRFQNKARKATFISILTMNMDQSMYMGCHMVCLIFQIKDLISCRNGFGKFGITTLAYGVSGPKNWGIGVHAARIRHTRPKFIKQKLESAHYFFIMVLSDWALDHRPPAYGVSGP